MVKNYPERRMMSWRDRKGVTHPGIIEVVDGVGLLRPYGTEKVLEVNGVLHESMAAYKHQLWLKREEQRIENLRRSIQAKSKKVAKKVDPSLATDEDVAKYTALPSVVKAMGLKEKKGGWVAVTKPDGEVVNVRRPQVMEHAGEILVDAWK
jgi:hypothetical protein